MRSGDEMLDWFLQQDSTVKAAMIAGGATIIVALIGGIFKLIEVVITSRRNKGQTQNSNINITQSSKGGKNNTFIGVQNNRKE